MHAFANYHTHSCRCGHATGTEEDYVRAAIEAGWEVLGYSDHIPWPYKSGFRTPTVRMGIEELDDQLAVLRVLRENYREQLRLYIGFEAEYFPEYLSWLKEMKEAQNLDYLLLGNHFELTDENGLYYGRCTEKAQICRYTDNTIRGMETGLFCCLAHPDLYLMDYPVFDDTAKDCAHTLLTAAKELHIPIEYNLQGIRLAKRGKAKGLSYPYLPFWELAAEVGNVAMVGMDAHSPDALRETEDFDAAYEKLQAMGLTVIDRLDGLE